MAKEWASFTLNKGLMADPEVDKFKVWPTQLDRGQFVDVEEFFLGTKTEPPLAGDASLVQRDSLYLFVRGPRS